LFLRSKGLVGRGYDAPEGFVVLAESQAAKESVPSIPPYVTDQRNGLMSRGLLVPNGDALVLTQDYTFDSPSAAAGVLLGRSANGRTEWKDENGRTLKDIQTSANAEE